MTDSHARRTAAVDAMVVEQQLPYGGSCIIKEVGKQVQGGCCMWQKANSSIHVQSSLGLIKHCPVVVDNCAAAGSYTRLASRGEGTAWCDMVEDAAAARQVSFPT